MTAKFKVVDLPPEADADLSVRAHNQHSGPEALHTWESPDWSILDDRRGELPDFPLDCVGEPLQQWVERASAGAGVTAAMLRSQHWELHRAWSEWRAASEHHLRGWSR
jgi:hypothetical protein